jgi:hypothetical protein
MTAPSHESPLLLVLDGGATAADGIRAVLAHKDVDCWSLPPPWVLERAGIDLPSALPGLGQLSLDNLDGVLEALLARCHADHLDALVAHLWREADERVRTWYLERGALETLASIVRLKPRASELDPPPAFVQDRIHEHAFVVEYRLVDAGALDTPTAPPGEGSLVLYPFDPPNAAARVETGLAAGSEVILEAFAYESGRERHRVVLEAVAEARGWNVLDRG